MRSDRGKRPATIRIAKGIVLYPPGSRKGNRTYHVRVSNHGRRTEADLNTTDARVARQCAKEVAAGHRRAVAGAPVPKTFGEVADHYADGRDVSTRTRAFLDRMKREIGHRLVAELVPGDLAAAANAIYPKAKAQTKNRAVLTPGAAVLHYAAEQGWCAYWRVRKLPEPEPETRRPAPGVPALMITEAEGGLKALLTFLFLQGWRITETLELTPERLDLSNARAQAWVGKIKRWKWVPLHPQVVTALANWLPNRPKTRLVFPWTTRWGAYRAIRELLVRLVAKGHNVKFSPHMARHWFGSELGDQQFADRDIMEAGTWVNAKSVSRYNRARAEAARDTIGTLEIAAKERGKTGGSSRKVRFIK